MSLGHMGENLAAEYLRSQGFIVIDRNYRSRVGEIDIIAQKADTLYFIEVKTRTRDGKYGKPYEAVTYGKQVHMRRSAKWYVLKNNLQKSKLRLAVVSVELKDNLETLKLYELD